MADLPNLADLYAATDERRVDFLQTDPALALTFIDLTNEIENEAQIKNITQWLTELRAKLGDIIVDLKALEIRMSSDSRLRRCLKTRL